SGPLALVWGSASILLPRVAVAHAAENRERLMKYYLRGTFASFVILLVASVAACFAAPLLFKAWFGSKLLATRAILPLVMIHTIVGGTSAVGRSILIGMGRVKAYTIAVLIAGVANVLLSFTFVRY